MKTGTSGKTKPKADNNNVITLCTNILRCKRKPQKRCPTRWEKELWPHCRRSHVFSGHIFIYVHLGLFPIGMSTLCTRRVWPAGAFFLLHITSCQRVLTTVQLNRNVCFGWHARWVSRSLVALIDSVQKPTDTRCCSGLELRIKTMTGQILIFIVNTTYLI